MMEAATECSGQRDRSQVPGLGDSPRARMSWLGGKIVGGGLLVGPPNILVNKCPRRGEVTAGSLQ